MARIKPQALLVQSKKKKGPTRISTTTIILCNLVVVLIVLSLVTMYRHWSKRTRQQIGSGTSTIEDATDTFTDSKKYDLPGYALLELRMKLKEKEMSTIISSFRKRLCMILNTSKGYITVELHKDGSPGVVDKFLDMHQKGYFNGMPFHHIIKHYIIQGGHSQWLGAVEDWTGKGNLHGRLATSSKNEAFMVGTSKVKGGKEFDLFITTAPIPDLNDKLMVFGSVIKGEGVVQEIEEVDTDEHFQPKSPIGIINVTLKTEL